MTASRIEHHPTDGLVHGMQNDFVAPDWLALSDREVVDVLSQFFGGDTVSSNPPLITWRSPRPMSAGALVAIGAQSVFVKRHHIRLRSRERLEVEHEFARHLRSRGVATPAALTSQRGSSVVERGDFLYEVHEVAIGVDVYRDVPSWYPFQQRAHARSAGSALARFHSASSDFDAPPWPFGALIDSVEVIAADNPTESYLQLASSRPGLIRATAAYDLRGDFESILRGPIERATLRTRGLESLWTHGDWHASNLTWDDSTVHASVVSVLDLGLSNRTYAAHDLAVAIERNIIDWLDTADVGSITVDYDAFDALLAGYQEVTALTSDDLETLCVLLPVAHVEFALSEVEYFGAIVDSPDNLDLAYRSYLLGHVQWFDSPAGVALLAHLVHISRGGDSA